MTANVLVSRDGPVVTVTLNRPACRNAVDDETAVELRAAFSTFDADASASVAVLAGEGEHFCGGYDLKSLASKGMDYQPSGPGPMGPTRMLLSKPVIAAVEGFAVAGGLELALWCDLRICSESAVFGVYCRRWGVPLIDGGTVRLPRLIGQSRAIDMILTGRSVDSAEALAFGLANRVVSIGLARQTAQQMASQIARFPQVCLRADRTSVYAQWGAELGGALEFEGVHGERPLMQEARIGAARFRSGLGRSGDFDQI
jgi:enoyl-CoA hydratase